MKLINFMLVDSLLLFPAAAYAQSEQTPVNAPPVAPTLVREGDFAAKLVTALKIGSAENEAEAETMLASSGIAPKNGWVADYPVTPDVIGELQNGVATAAESNRLPMGRDEALQALKDVSADLGLPVVADTSDNYAESQPPANPPYTEPSVVNNYYYDEGPPVVTYYPPPWDYDYLYAWVPCPFFFSGFFFSGFFILHDFHRVMHGHGGKEIFISNHVFNPITRRVGLIDPSARRSRTAVNSARIISHKGGFNTTGAKNGASSIFSRSLQRAPTTRGVTGRNSVSSVPGGYGRQPFVNGRTSVLHSRSSRSFNGSSQIFGRSFSAPSRSFSAPPIRSRGSFGGFHAGGGTFVRHGGRMGGSFRGRS
jgi:hypothetical protein